MFDAKTVERFDIASADVENCMTDYERFADLLNGFVATQKPDGLPYLTLSVAQAEIIRDMFAMPWIQAKFQILAFEKLAHLPIYAGTLGTPQSYAAVKGAREALARCEYILQHLTHVAPEVDPKEFIVFQKDKATHMVTPMMNPILMEQYRERLFKAWQEIPIKTEAANENVRDTLPES